MSKSLKYITYLCPDSEAVSDLRAELVYYDVCSIEVRSGHHIKVGYNVPYSYVNQDVTYHPELLQTVPLDFLTQRWIQSYAPA